ncbi:MAG: hypothetical protein UW68_C0006G0024 [Candidatus Collierbacteria bacterium GW2011_GWB1_44_6]|uniref:Uncharacterized protein n=2 Tax=Candidatus Collieribacteriota TaxID=1752725 RepID=A0A0G1LXN3_9BACT|nr:MAG: hypothetical protein UV68_C0023G0012 [Candidatus Collierbacteria bacterium GW2011_GWC2_43_12]KKT73582.1 MAG: hypothetical protein UW68_C0006G0024 [Candidatus Collierbacteria bacterium GW2011_GWB1_44_6]KKT83259.1 MAG: hypothetical protein UW80_C0018G0010 [Microgenomates group bacterium GW2011_GWC1_44_9]
MPSHDYDSFSAMSIGIMSLKNLNELIKARHDARYRRGEMLNEWVVLGRFLFDSCGNTLQFTSDIPAEIFPNIPSVLAYQDFNQFLIRNHAEQLPMWASFANSIPSTTVHCPECGAQWTIRNCHDAIRSNENRIIGLGPFVGQRLSDVIASWDRINTADWCIREVKSGSIVVHESHIVRENDKASVEIFTYQHTSCHQSYLKRTGKTPRT